MKILDRKLDKDKTRRDYKKVAWFYDGWSWLTESKASKKVIQLSQITDGEKILEVACGTGLVFKQIVLRNPNGTNIGIDLSGDMLRKARARLKKSSGSYELKESDALDLNYDDEEFDIVINNFMVDLMPEKSFQSLANEYFRLLKPGGVLVISTFSFGKKKINRFWLWVAKHFPALLTGCRPVSFRQYLAKANFTIEEDLYISQNTFPSEVLKARKAI